MTIQGIYAVVVVVLNYSIIYGITALAVNKDEGSALGMMFIIGLVWIFVLVCLLVHDLFMLYAHLEERNAGSRMYYRHWPIELKIVPMIFYVPLACLDAFYRAWMRV